MLLIGHLKIEPSVVGLVGGFLAIRLLETELAGHLKMQLGEHLHMQLAGHLVMR
jgi:hypothetical protein